jgi:hypothetical protein
LEGILLISIGSSPHLSVSNRNFFASAHVEIDERKAFESNRITTLAIWRIRMT